MKLGQIPALALSLALLASCAARPGQAGTSALPDGAQSEPGPAAADAAQEPALPELESAQALDELTPVDFGCFLSEYPTQYDTYALLPGDGLENTVYTLTGPESGPAIYVVGGTHGDELAGWYAGTLLKKAAVRAGTVYIVAPFNQYGAEHDQRKTRGGWDLNRHFPGDLSGNDADRMAAALYADIQDKGPDLVLDLHEALYHTDGRDNLGGSIICQDMGLVSDLVLSMLTESGGGTLPVTQPLMLYGSPPAGSLNQVVTQELGIPVITVETDRTEGLNTRVRNQLLVAEYVFLWYNML